MQVFLHVSKCFIFSKAIQIAISVSDFYLHLFCIFFIIYNNVGVLNLPFVSVKFVKIQDKLNTSHFKGPQHVIC